MVTDPIKRRVELIMSYQAIKELVAFRQQHAPKEPKAEPKQINEAKPQPK